jgi:DMSO/TMAO reductase YedYZ molybdopterin-dependent catalytic subunit
LPLNDRLGPHIKNHKLQGEGLFGVTMKKVKRIPSGSSGEASGGSPLIIRTADPPNLETPLELLDSYITPNDAFFVRCHLPPPQMDLAKWRLEIDGMVKAPATLTIGQLEKMEVVTLEATLQCAGNGRVSFQPSISGVQWQSGAISNAVWTGVRLRDLLQNAGVDSAARHVGFSGYDLPPTSSTPSWVRSIPLERAMDPTTLLAFEMNGERLPFIHGAPLRLVVPGWAGAHWMKWIHKITPQEDEAEGRYMQSEYRLPDGAGERAKEIALTENVVNSIITKPLQGARLKRGVQLLSGIALAGCAAVERVDISIDAGLNWAPAKVEPQKSAGVWQQWRYEWRAETPGKLVILARATDSQRRVQPETTPWNHGGYMWNGLNRIECEII